LRSGSDIPIQDNTTAEWPWSTLWAGYAAAAWAFLFAAVSFYWAAGGTAGVETIGDVITKPALARDPAMIATLWGSGVVKIIVGLLALALVQSWGELFSRRMLIIASWVVGMLLVLYGAGNSIQHGLMVADVIGVPESVDLTAVRWHLVLWDPVWLAGGVLFVVAAWSYRKRSSSPGLPTRHDILRVYTRKSMGTCETIKCEDDRNKRHHTNSTFERLLNRRSRAMDEVGAKVEQDKEAKKTSPPSRAGPREWMGLSVLALACILYSMDLTVLHLAVPHISADLKPTSSQLLWIIDIYGFFVAGSLITMGNLGDRIGRRRLLLIGAVGFGITSVLAAFSISTEMLIVTRAFMGISAATLAPSTLSLIRNMFHDPNQRTFAIGVWVSSFSAGAAIGPLLGGVLLEYFWWGSVFLLAVPVMVVLLVLGRILLPEFKDPKARRLDPVSAALSLAAILAVIYGVKEIAQDGLGLQPILVILAGVAAGAVFLRRQRRIEYPLIDLHLFRIRAFGVSIATYVLGVFVAFGVFVFIAQHLQLVIGLSPLQAGLWMLPWALSFVVGSTLTPAIVRHIRPGLVIGGGLALAAIGFGLLTQIDDRPSFAIIGAGLAISSLGLAPAFTLATDFVVGFAPPERAGAASAISETSGELGGALGIAILGSIGTAIYRTELARTIPVGIPPEAQEAARDTLSGAVGVASQLPGDLGSLLLNSARESFIQGLHLTVLISIAVAAVAAVLVFFALRNTQRGLEQDEKSNLTHDGTT
jgi:DHA2 family multidrug resistance protein-like MFS transporter